MPWVPRITSDFSLTPFYSALNNRTENSELNLTSHIATGPPQHIQSFQNMITRGL